MKKQWVLILGGAAVASAVVLSGCSRNAEPVEDGEPGMGARSGAAVDTAVDRTGDAAKTTGAAAKDMTGKALEKTGETLEKAGAAMEGSGTRMQEKPEPVPTGK
jgi:hypothetical protein